MGELYRIDELRALEARAKAGLAQGTLMRRAGEESAGWIETWLRGCGSGGARSVLVLCGPGDNGGDGFVCARALRERGFDCTCWAPLASQSTDSVAARSSWIALGGTVATELPSLDPFDLVVDALFGIGAQRPLAEPMLSALREAGESAAAIVALDTPSGLNADTGAWIGGVHGAHALHTLTFLADKPGLHTADGADASGEVHVFALGVEDAPAVAGAGHLNGPAQFASITGARRRNSNKGDFGVVCVVGGARGMVGAAILAGRAALRLGAGRVYVEAIGAPAFEVDLAQPELMFRNQSSVALPHVLVIGCGMGTDDPARARLARAFEEHSGRAVLDADALNCIAADKTLRTRLRQRDAFTLLTPHPGEAARLLGSSGADVQRDRMGAAGALARELNAMVLLKGAGTVLAEPKGRYWINVTGTPALASAGTGDVLAGMAGALLAQHEDAVAAVCAAVWAHGRAAQDLGGEFGLVASDIPAAAAAALNALVQPGRS
jgi:ADP-dependent NAD(P)H-hydrate dehydratase / NAD(P)H-hydrate epimerase